MEAARWKRKGKHVELAVELDGNQAAHVYGLEKEMQKRGDWYSFARGINEKDGSTRKGILSKQNGKNKHERFRLAAQWFYQGKIWFPEHLKTNSVDMQELIAQIKGITHSEFTRADDGPDCISLLYFVKRILPTVTINVNNVDTGSYDPFWDDVDDSRKVSLTSGYV
jgi:hypothetical protein